MFDFLYLRPSRFRVAGSLFALFVSAASQAGVTVYVSPTGNDAWTGLSVSRVGSSSTGPVASLSRARDVVRAYRLSSGDQSTANVQISAGTYFMTASLSLGAQDNNVNFSAQGNGVVRLSGGHTISGWRAVDSLKAPKGMNRAFTAKIVQASLPASGITNYGTLQNRSVFAGVSQPSALELIYNDAPMTLAQWPNVGYAHIRSVNGSSFTIDSLVKKYVAPASTGMVCGYFNADWADFNQKMTSFNSATNTLQTAMPAQFGIASGGRVKVVNFIEELDSAGEYFVDRTTGMIYFYPPTPIAHGVTVGTMMELPLVQIIGSTNVTFSGLTIENTRGNAVTIDVSNTVLFDKCTIRNAGEGAFVINVSPNSGVQNSTISDIGNAGVYIYGGDRATLTPGAMFVDNCKITRFGRIEKCYHAAVYLSGDGNRVTNCTISNAPHVGIQFIGNDHVIQNNVIDSVCKETGDAGAIYTGRDVTSLGTVISGNIFTNLQPTVNRPGQVETVCAIYLDDNATGITVTGNAFWNVSQGMLIGGGACNTVQNNMFIQTTTPVYIDARSAVNTSGFGPTGGYTQQINALGSSLSLYRSRYPQWAAWLDGNRTLPRFTVVSHNIFPNSSPVDFADSTYTIPNVTMTQNAASTSPAANPALGDFTLTDPSLMSSIGFQPIHSGSGASGLVGAGAQDGTLTGV